MPVAQRALLSDLQKQVRVLEDDVRERASSTPDVGRRLRDEHAEARRVGRTATSFGEWLDSQVVQAAVAWVLATVFVRFSEDNRLVDEAWIAGPGERLREAMERQQHHLVSHGDQNDRDWILAAVEHLAGFPALTRLFDQGHNPMFRLEISADAAEALLAFWRRRTDDGGLVHDLTDPDLSTRFLGDLYQDMSEAARKQYALLQTPDFVEELILDLTLDPAMETFGLDDLKMIDPTCGSGHFLLGAFDRLLDAWTRQAPSLPERERVRRALDSVHGVDVNPFASAIARFRLTVAAMKAEGLRRLTDAPGYPLHVGTGDSLLHGKAEAGELFDSGLATHTYVSEDLDEHPEILKRGRYHVVVGNPPYITVKDKALNEAYRAGYETCSGKYALSVPFAELFFKLAVHDRDRPGYVGQITSNSFMKREFGKKLVEQFFPSQELTHVIDTSGAYIPGHSTPTVILVGKRRHPRPEKLQAVLGIRGEPAAPSDPRQGLVWRSIVEHLGESGYENEYVSVADLPRERLAGHPWSLTGGGADELKIALETGRRRLAGRVESIGFGLITGDDEVYSANRKPPIWHRLGVSTRTFVEGDRVRDFTISDAGIVIYPYVTPAHADRGLAGSEVFWPYRSTLRAGLAFGKTREERGLEWFDYMLPNWPRIASTHLIAFAFVATHNHFVLDRGGKVFKQSAPVIKLPERASEDDHLALLGVLNSSTVCFWLKQVSQNKGNATASSGMPDQPWSWNWEFTGTKLQELPLPNRLDTARAAGLDDLARELAKFEPRAVVEQGTPSGHLLDQSERSWNKIRNRMVTEQEELDWSTYELYGLVDGSWALAPGEAPAIQPGQRAFEIALARDAEVMRTTKWFSHNGSFVTAELPEEWSPEYRQLVERRIELIHEDRSIGLLESTDCKRRWMTRPRERARADALRGWLLDRLEDEALWRSGGFPTTQSIALLAGKVASDATFLEVLELWAGGTVSDPAKELARLLADEHVPYLAAHRYKESGLRTRAGWEQTWDLQRREDAGEAVDVPVPAKYTSADFARPSYWKHRGKLDVPKERFISYPGAERGADTSMVLGWAGWDHAEQAQALALMADDRQRREGWEADRLTPLLAGLAELEPWLHQWHDDIDARTGQSPAQAGTGVLEAQLTRLHLTRQDLAAWRPPAPTRGRKPRSTAP